jgi:N-methylhydantoinase B
VVFGPARGTMQVFYFADFGHHPPAGVLCGADGSLAAVEKIDRDGNTSAMPTIGDVELAPGEWVRGLESGGGGYGDPLDRDPETVRLDVLDGWITASSAREDYGVVLAGQAEFAELVVDLAATEILRRRLRSDRV